MSERSLPALAEMANRLRIHSVEATSKANSGHPTSCCSIAEIVSVLFFDTMRYSVRSPRDPNNDRFILSKGHAAPILYAAWAEAGLFPVADLLKLREIGSDLEGHPTPRLPFVDVATGSLGQGLSVGCGMAYAAEYLEKADYRVFVLMGDGESAEGSVWEALAFASHYGLDNLTAIIDVNRLGQSDPTMLKHDTATYQKRLEAFGWHAAVVDGHDIGAVAKALDAAAAKAGKPSAIIAKTLKGKGLVGIEDKEAWHGKALGDKTATVLAHLKAKSTNVAPPTPKLPTGKIAEPAAARITLSPPSYKVGDKVATRQAYGAALARLGASDSRVVALDGDTKNSTFAEKFRDAHPDRYIECFIAEQNLVGVGVGLGTRGKIPFVSTFACFLSRAFDQIRMAAISQSNVNLCGSHCGVSIGEDGPSQMALEDLAAFRAVPNMVIFYPSDAISAERAVELAANERHMTYIRTSRPALPVLYGNDESFAVGRAKVLRSSPKDQATVIGAGVTLHEVLAAADLLAKDGIAIRVIDPFTIKPLDRHALTTAAHETSGIVLTVEDHYREGGIGEAVAATLGHDEGLMIHQLAVGEVPRSGQPAELLAKYGIDAAHIAAKVKAIVSG